MNKRNNQTRDTKNIIEKLAKIGRFLFLLPYILGPFIIYGNGKKMRFLKAFIRSWFAPFKIKMPLTLVYPFCWVVAIVSLVICIKSVKNTDGKNLDLRKYSADKNINTVLFCVAVVFAALQIISLIYTRVILPARLNAI